LLAALVHIMEAPRSPFYRPKRPRSRWNPIWKAILAFCRVAHRTLSGARFPSKNGAVDRCSLRVVGAPDTVRCTPDSPVPPSDRWLGHASRADCAADRWPSRPLAHRTVRCIIVVRRQTSPESGLFTGVQPGAPDTVRCTTGQSGVPSRAEIGCS
jgi:hypothetical protein